MGSPLIFDILSVDLYRVVGSFLGDIDIVGVALLESCTCDLDELRLLMKRGDINAAAITHT